MNAITTSNTEYTTWALGERLAPGEIVYVLSITTQVNSAWPCVRGRQNELESK